MKLPELPDYNYVEVHNNRYYHEETMEMYARKAVREFALQVANYLQATNYHKTVDFQVSEIIRSANDNQS